MKEDTFVLQVKCYKLSPTMIFLSSWWNDCKKRNGSRLRSGRSDRKPISTCKCRLASDHAVGPCYPISVALRTVWASGAAAGAH